MDNMSGQKFGKLTVLELLSEKNYNQQYRTICDCGNEHVTNRRALKAGESVQCKPCSLKQRGESRSTNGSSKERYTYSSYRSMHQRCKNFEAYKHVEICEEWQDPHGFPNFLRDMG